MSRAFVREDDGGGREVLPDLPVSPLPNLVTARGLAQIEARIAEAEAGLAEAGPAQGGLAEAGLAEAGPGRDEGRLARLRRDLRYWRRRRASARPTAPDPADPSVQFGSRVTYRPEDGPARRVRIVGEDEADPAAGAISYAAPVARALTGATAGAWVTASMRGRPAEFEILAVENGPEG